MDSESRRIFIIVPLGIALGGLAFFIIGTIRLRSERAFARGATQAAGVVVGLQRRRLRRSSNMHSSLPDFPVVRYITQTGQQIEFESPSATQPRVVREGQAVTVLYDPATPQQARIASGCLQYGLPTVPGRKSGVPRTTPVALGERDGRRWLVSPYGEVDWVRNLRAAGGGTLTRGRYTLRFTATTLGPQEAAPIIKESVAGAPGFIRKYFAVDPAAPLPAFERIAAEHPVFELHAV